MQRTTWSVRVILGGILAMACGTPPVSAQQPKDEPSPAKAEETFQGETASVWMRKKLDLSRNILGGIATGDFEEISKNASSMRTLSKFESFARRSSPGYRTQVDYFESSVDEIIRQAKRENLEGVTLGFYQLTHNCVSCHKHLREKK